MPLILGNLHGFRAPGGFHWQRWVVGSRTWTLEQMRARAPVTLAARAVVVGGRAGRRRGAVGDWVAVGGVDHEARGAGGLDGLFLLAAHRVAGGAGEAGLGLGEDDGWARARGAGAGAD